MIVGAASGLKKPRVRAILCGVIALIVALVGIAVGQRFWLAPPALPAVSPWVLCRAGQQPAPHSPGSPLPADAWVASNMPLSEFSVSFKCTPPDAPSSTADDPNATSQGNGAHGTAASPDAKPVYLLRLYTWPIGKSETDYVASVRLSYTTGAATGKLSWALEVAEKTPTATTTPLGGPLNDFSLAAAPDGHGGMAVSLDGRPTSWVIPESHVAVAVFAPSSPGGIQAALGTLMPDAGQAAPWGPSRLPLIALMFALAAATVLAVVYRDRARGKSGSQGPGERPELLDVAATKLYELAAEVKRTNYPLPPRKQGAELNDEWFRRLQAYIQAGISGKCDVARQEGMRVVVPPSRQGDSLSPPSTVQPRSDRVPSPFAPPAAAPDFAESLRSVEEALQTVAEQGEQETAHAYRAMEKALAEVGGRVAKLDQSLETMLVVRPRNSCT